MRRISPTLPSQRRNKESCTRLLRSFRRPIDHIREGKRIQSGPESQQRGSRRGRTRQKRLKRLSSYRIITVGTNRLVPHRLTGGIARIFELFPRLTFYIFPFINLLGRYKLYESYIYFMFSCSVKVSFYIKHE